MTNAKLIAQHLNLSDNLDASYLARIVIDYATKVAEDNTTDDIHIELTDADFEQIVDYLADHFEGDHPAFIHLAEFNPSDVAKLRDLAANIHRSIVLAYLANH